VIPGQLPLWTDEPSCHLCGSSGPLLTLGPSAICSDAEACHQRRYEQSHDHGQTGDGYLEGWQP
jgi:hypothetical protein